MDEAFKVLENHLIFRTVHADWFDLSDERVLRMKELLSSGYAYPLVERDAEGRRIIIFNQARLNPDEFKSDDSFHLFFTMFFTLLMEEETQISGVSFILNFDGVAMRHLYSVTELVNIVKFLKNSCPGRTKAFYLINLPTFHAYLINAVKAVLTKKLKSRLMMVKTVDDISQFVDKSLLPKELGGGKFTETEMMEKFMEMLEGNLTHLKRMSEFVIDLNKLSASRDFQDNIGSFRKLEID